jgi:hypothetical protein
MQIDKQNIDDILTALDRQIGVLGGRKKSPERS